MKTILITGVSRGLGRALAEEFILLGHTVIGCGRSEKEIMQLQKQFPAPNDFAVVDVSSDEQVAAWAKRVLPSHAAPDLLLNNAALINRNAPLWKVPAQEFSDVIDVNLKGVANVIRHFVPAMIKQGRGVIVNFSSAGAARPTRKSRLIARRNGRLKVLRNRSRKNCRRAWPRSRSIPVSSTPTCCKAVLPAAPTTIRRRGNGQKPPRHSC
jgi:NAD(P)-dependent dehydrogenase (short-subunit alcohol dehydrogenase family)